MKLLVIGARGAFGRAACGEALRRGHQVRALVRPGRGAADAGRGAEVEWAFGDAFNEVDVERAATGVDAIIFAFNVPYPDWAKDLLRATDTVARVAARLGLRVMIPGNVYGLGVPLGPADERAPRQAVSRKGQLRNAMEKRLQESTEQKSTGQGAKLLIVRAGDFFGAGASSSWMAFMTRSLGAGKVIAPTKSEARHEWAYLPDMAAVTLALLEREAELARCETFHFGGHRLTMSDMLDACDEAIGRRLRRQVFPWWALRLATPFWKMAPELLEMRYLWEQEVLLDDAKLLAFLGPTAQTPLVSALRRAFQESTLQLEPAIAS